MIPLVVLGATEFSAEIAQVIRDTGRYSVEAFVENDVPERANGTVDGLPVVWIDEAAPLARTHIAVCGLGTTTRRRFTHQAQKLGFEFATIVHPSAHVAESASLGEGTVVSAGVIVGAHTSIGRHVIVNRGCLIGHHTTIDDHVSLQSGANIAGLCFIGAGTYVGMGALVLNTVRVGAGAVVAAGAVVTREVPANVQVMGVPARIVKEGVDGR